MLVPYNGNSGDGPPLGELFDATPPHDAAAERAVLGAVLLKPSVLSEVDAILQPDHFYLEHHEIIFAAMLFLRASGQQPDTTLLHTRLKAIRQLKAAGGAAYLGELLQSCPTATNAVHYAEIVRDHAARRAAIRHGEDVIRGIHSGHPTGAILADSLSTLQTLAAADPGNGAPVDASGPDFRPFPVESLPQPVRRYIEQAAHAIGCDPSFVALPVLSALAGTIGNTRVILLKRGWAEPAVLWTAIIGPSGTTKSPALEMALAPLYRRQALALRDYRDAMQLYAVESGDYHTQLKAWQAKGRAAGEPQPEPPSEPVPERFWCSDVTVEALAVRLQASPLLIVRDELAGWFGGFDQYKGGKGGDCAHWLTMHGARNMLVDRKTGEWPTVFVPRAAVSVTGGIQPEVLRRALGQEHFDNGLASRLLLTSPPVQAKTWTEAEVQPAVQTQYAELIDVLLALEPGSDEDGEACPAVLGLTKSGKALWVPFYNAHNQEQAGLEGNLRAAWSKLEGAAPRLALIVHLVRQAAGDATLEAADAIDAASVQAGITLAQWFGHEAQRVYGRLQESRIDADRRELVELIRGLGGSVTARDLMHKARRYRGSVEDADAALDDLAKQKLGCWMNVPTTARGGAPTRRCVLAPSGNGNTTPAKPAISAVPLPLPPGTTPNGAPAERSEAAGAGPAEDDPNEEQEWSA